VDLVIAAMLINVWIWHDAQAHGRNPWGWIIATLIVGSFSPLLYLITRNSSKISE
jgi:RsiW-degrading membrane proteinase PrsW (M82 family)